MKKLSHDDLIFSDSHYFHEFDRALACSGLAPDQMSDHMVADVISDKRHHGTDVNLLSEKWGIELNIRSALLPLTHRYRTNMLS